MAYALEVSRVAGSNPLTRQVSSVGVASRTSQTVLSWWKTTDDTDVSRVSKPEP